MTIFRWIVCILFSIFIISFAIFISEGRDTIIGKVLTFFVALLLIVGIFVGGFWLQNNTASGMRALTDQRADFSNGLEREINVYTADGNLIAHYEGKIDLEDNAGGYVLFDYEGKRYTYYNCFIESIANIH